MRGDSVAVAVTGARANTKIRGRARIVARRATETFTTNTFSTIRKSTTLLVAVGSSEARFAAFAAITSEVAQAGAVERRELTVPSIDAIALIFAASFIEDPSCLASAVASTEESVRADTVTRAVEDNTRVGAVDTRVARVALTFHCFGVASTVIRANGGGTTDAGEVAEGASPTKIASTRTITGLTVGATTVFAEAGLIAVLSVLSL